MCLDFLAYEYVLPVSTHRVCLHCISGNLNLFPNAIQVRVFTSITTYVQYITFGILYGRILYGILYGAYCVLYCSLIQNTLLCRLNLS